MKQIRSLKKPKEDTILLDIEILLTWEVLKE